MSPDEDAEIEALLRRLADRATGRGSDPGDVWALAAGELSEDEKEKVLRALSEDRAALAELGIASLILDDEERVDWRAAQASADAALKRIRAKRRASIAWRVCTLAAAGFLVAASLLLQFGDHGRRTIAWKPFDVAPEIPRGGSSPSSLQFRVEMAPSAVGWAMLFVVGASANGITVRRLHPAIPAFYADARNADWPRNPLRAGVVTRLPPAGVPPFSLGATEGYLVLIFDASAEEESEIEATRARIESSLASRALDLGEIDRALAPLRRDGRTIEVTGVKPH